MNQMLLIVPIIGLLGLLFAIMLRLHVIKQDPGNQKMQKAQGLFSPQSTVYLLSLLHCCLLSSALEQAAGSLQDASWWEVSFPQQPAILE